MHPHDQYSTWAEIDLTAIRGNVSYISQSTQTPVMAVVKANAYGHGALPISQAALQAGATWLAVARLEEALELRQAGILVPILLLGHLSPQRFGLAIQSNLSLTIWTVEQMIQISKAASHLGLTARLHFKIDTGMSRLGFQLDELDTAASVLRTAPTLHLEGAYTHFARADEPDPAPTLAQVSLFTQSLASLAHLGLHPDWVHASNSAAGLKFPSAHLNLIRLGIAMYGLPPSSATPLPESMRPALSWKTVLSHVKTLPAGRGVSYGHTYITRRAERIGTIPVGYADGLRRTYGNQALVQGQVVPVIGRVCMDQSMLQLDAVTEAQPGDEVVLIGQQSSAGISATDIASIWKTINYEVVCGIGSRVPRIYINE
jgi:alanine racemase